MKRTLQSILHVLAGICGGACILLSIWMAVVAKDLLFTFYSLVLAAVLIRAAVTKHPDDVKDAVDGSEIYRKEGEIS